MPLKSDDRVEDKRQLARKSFQEIVSVNEQILNSMKVQKAHSFTVLQRWESAVKEELSLPSNRYLQWYHLVNPFLDAVIHSKLIDQEIEKKLLDYLDSLKEYESNYILDYSIIEQLELTIDRMGAIIQKLEAEIEQKKNREPAHDATVDMPPDKEAVDATSVAVEDEGIKNTDEYSYKNNEFDDEADAKEIGVSSMEKKEVGDLIENKKEGAIDLEQLKNLKKSQQILKKLGIKYN